ncbi:acyltransferase family protein [Halomonas korlensis]|uniref:Peptidoglycan/LPS O-acetylase OafA/YrhL, contains acyltransferase and SGNH-hydrolase domains n=1 Tax=Halomonas korlensis TaxID=463301 RepID=A0A1I7FCE3_9GAMM|nr:acyltransferase family protein [Halomonas korlensis]SFU33842.1 Peptidoglycan/LPS O-acetylase OafA/YrhL, contains acyltransferase and SGNH-hydrolase domains [Halomonas korlensis]
MTTTYRPEVDGLRAVAVIPVILFHAGFEWFSGGYVGVDIFFVVSGYLITGIIYGELLSGNFSIINFYERRARRILPALFFVSIACLVTAWLWMLPEEFQNLSESLVAVNLFVSNIYFWQDSGYFAGPAEMEPFLHTWSLAVEEQFYVFFPLFMLLVWRFGRGLLLGVIALGFVASLALAEYGSVHHPSANFFLLPTRAWELLAGAILAIYMHDHSVRPSSRTSNVAGALGLGLILYAIFSFDESTPFPSLWAVIPILGTSLIILYANGTNVIGRLLSLKPVVGIGLISYSAYLWHQPVFVFARERSLNPISHVDYILFSILSLLLAWFSWRYVEQPFRSRKNFTRPQIFKAGLAMSCLMIGIGLYGSYSKGIPWRLDDDVERLAEVRSDQDINSGSCQSQPGDMRSIDEICEYNDKGPGTVVVWGDSQATPLVGPVAERVDALGMKVKQFVYTNCLPIAGYTRSDEPECGRFNNDAMEYLLGNDDVELVVMLGRYPMQFEGETFNNGEGGIETDRAVHAVPFDAAGDSMTDDYRRVEAVGELLQATVDKLVNDGKQVVLIYPVPEVGWNVPYLLAKEKLYGIERTSPLSTSYDVFKERAASAYQQLSKVAPHDGLLKIEPARLFCDTYLPGRCATQVEENILYYDNNHLSQFGASVLVEHVFHEMRSKGWLSDKELKLSLLSE